MLYYYCIYRVFNFSLVVLPLIQKILFTKNGASLCLVVPALIRKMLFAENGAEEHQSKRGSNKVSSLLCGMSQCDLAHILRNEMCSRSLRSRTKVRAISKVKNHRSRPKRDLHHTPVEHTNDEGALIILTLMTKVTLTLNPWLRSFPNSGIAAMGPVWTADETNTFPGGTTYISARWAVSVEPDSSNIRYNRWSNHLFASNRNDNVSHYFCVTSVTFPNNRLT